MRRSFFTSAVALILPAVLLAQSNPPAPKPVARPQFNADEKKELEKWGIRNREELGTLLTPPRGRIDPQYQKIRADIYKIIEELAGDKIKGKGLKIIVSLWSNNTVRYGPDAVDPVQMQRQWEYEEKKGTWPIAPMMGLDPNAKFYELELSLGLLNKIRTRSEMAFIIGNMLSHILEGHTVEDTLGGWWSNQRYEGIADQQALDLMRGKFNLDDAVSILYRLLALDENNKKDQGEAVAQILKKEHHEGVRIAIVQAYIQYLRRQYADAQPVPAAAVPEYYRSDVRDRRVGIGKGPNKDIAAVIPDFLGIVNDHFLAHDPKMNWLTTNGGPEGSKYNFAAIRGSEEQGREMFVLGLEAIDKSKKSAQIKGDAAFMLAMFIDMHFNYKPLDKMTDAQSHKVASLHLKWTNDGWNPNKFVEYADNVTDNFSFSWVHGGLLSQLAYQQVVWSLVQVNDVWKKWVTNWPKQLAGEFHSAQSLAYSIFEQKENESHWKIPGLKELYANSILAFYKSRAYKDFYREARDNADGNYFRTVGWMRKFIDNNIDPAAGPAVELFKSQLDEFEKVRAEFFTKFNRYRNMTPERMNSLFEAMKSDNQVPMTDDLVELAQQAMMKYVRAYGEMDGLPNAKFATFSGPNSETFWAMSRALLSRRFNAEDKMMMAKYMATQKYFSSDFGDSKHKPEMIANIAAYVKSLSAEEFLKLLTSEIAMLNKGRETAYNDPEMLKSEKKYRDLEAEWKGIQKTMKASDPRYLAFFQEKLAPASFEMMDFIMVIKSYEALIASSHFSVLSLPGLDRGASVEIAKKFSFNELRVMTSKYYQVREAWKAPRKRWPNFYQIDDIPPRMSPATGLFLFDTLLATQSQAPTFEYWTQVYERIYRLGFTSLEMRTELKEGFESYMVEKFKTMRPAKVFDVIRREPFMAVLKAETASRLLLQYLDATLLGKKTLEQRAAELNRIIKDTKLKEKFPDLYAKLREDSALHLKMQPGEID
ncbi:MAG: hypothetical protein ABL958_15290, partial [Bdellovibrionia bacterium]